MIKSTIGWITILGMIVWFNVFVIPIGRDHAGNIVKQAVDIDTLIGVVLDIRGVNRNVNLLD